MPKRSILLLALTLVTPFAAAQDLGGRVQRQASNPLRMIIEASKIKPRQKTAEAARAPGKAAAQAAPAAGTAVDAAAQPAVPRNGDGVRGPAESAVATVEVEGLAVTEGAEASAAPAATPSAAPVPAVLELASTVEPVTPRSMIGNMRGEVQVHVAFTVNADGSVADAAVRKSSHPQMDAAVLEAVRQWRYQPIAAPRAHEVQLVLRQGD